MCWGRDISKPPNPRQFLFFLVKTDVYSAICSLSLQTSPESPASVTVLETSPMGTGLGAGLCGEHMQISSISHHPLVTCLGAEQPRQL